MREYGHELILALIHLTQSLLGAHLLRNVGEDNDCTDDAGRGTDRGGTRREVQHRAVVEMPTLQHAVYDLPRKCTRPRSLLGAERLSVDRLEFNPLEALREIDSLPLDGAEQASECW